MQENDDFITRKFEVLHVRHKSARTVTQYHYTKWPDFGVPADPNSLLHLMKILIVKHPPVPHCPLVVHCSAGIGRSGAFILAYLAILKTGEENRVLAKGEIYGILSKIRDCRMRLVQTQVQLDFAFLLIKEYPHINNRQVQMKTVFSPGHISLIILY